MKCYVVYCSSTGFTKQYAEWIAQSLKCEAKSIKEVTKAQLQDQDVVIYGGWIMGNMLNGLNKLKKLYSGKLVVFAVGANEENQEENDAIVSLNHLEGVPFYYFQGGFQFEKIGFMKRKMLSMVKNSIAKKTEKTANDLYMEKALSGSFDASNKDTISPLICYINENY